MLPMLAGMTLPSLSHLAWPEKASRTESPHRSPVSPMSSGRCQGRLSNEFTSLDHFVRKRSEHGASPNVSALPVYRERASADSHIKLGSATDAKARRGEAGCIQIPDPVWCGRRRLQFQSEGYEDGDTRPIVGMSTQ